MDAWSPRCPPPSGLVRPVGLDPRGSSGPTRAAARGARWRRTSPGLYVPAHVGRSVEQRILEVAAALPAGAVVTGWAALRLFGGGFFDGQAPDGSTPLDVPVLVPHTTRIAGRPGVRVLRDTRTPRPVDRHEVPCAPPERAVYDEMRLAADDREAVVVMDMAAAAGITSIRRVTRSARDEVRRPGAGRVRRGLLLASESSRSPTETRMRLVWELDAGFPAPLVNRAVLDGAGRLVGVADLLDVEAGVAGEYDGAVHRARARHRKDVARQERFRSVGLETFTVVAGDDVATQVGRMRAARDRALWLQPEQRRWSVVPRDERELTLDEWLDQRDASAGHDRGRPG